jgi:hypothetical protein
MSHLSCVAFALLAILPLLFGYFTGIQPLSRLDYLVYLLVQILLIGLLRTQRVPRNKTRSSPQMPAKRARKMPPHFEMLEREFFSLKPLFGQQSEGWREQHSESGEADDGGSMLKIHADDSGRVRVNMRLPLDAEMASKFLSQLTFDEFCEQFQLLRSDPESVKVYLKTRTIWPLAARDCYLVMNIKKLQDGSILCVGSSVENRSIEDRVVRMDIKLAGALLVPIVSGGRRTRGQSELFIILDCNPSGFIPPSIRNALISSYLPGYLHSLRDRMDGFRILSQPFEGISQRGDTRDLFESLKSINGRLDAIEKRLEASRVTRRRFAFLSWVPWILSGSMAVYLMHQRRGRIGAA